MRIDDKTGLPELPEIFFGMSDPGKFVLRSILVPVSDRDELADVVFSVNGDHDALDSVAIADAVLMAGWRKKPSRDDLIRIMAEADDQIVNEVSMPSMEYMYGRQADAILALMESGESNE